ncbi:RNA polymerase subunit sigma [Pseudomonas gingeri NCPPB 3146 = LMG 5327]|uniref:Sigma-70 family RNA polymerase sigma factor n=2 Tax=Pseudomonas gingeri TaxID=117681 RepID=A0A7Y7Y6K8_9PSED|nr:MULTISPECIES: sigma-70 family RNA polymerase sigma factor [Pseudomonas]NVZ28585.1 sigma-70 family RNA polymerase sigma factor [Pseudomonas gingeri]NVZ62683.1 sigma-70 family RNA polymerase sigma factor [Pseudomonas gingeri]NVZ79718.1 sigma-70 family RNA polymerase sigma factor [Pseudomonas gingeri]NWA08349.1 sigma-70 family RNA polymerase sigma factor [Pseudomonas gingeri]NWC18158.1 sigma-70 family RNA polymerase sigma factor [Pseudomonas gingeri]
MLSSDSIAHSSQASGIRQLNTEQVQKLRSFIKRRVMNPDDVEDIMQCTFLEALRNEHKFRFDSRPQTWLCGIALNLIRNHFRRQYKQPLQERWEDREDMELSDGVDIGAQIDGHRQLARVVRAIGTLPLTMQQVIQVSLEMDGNYQDTALSLGVPIGTVRSRLSRAREQLKRSVPSVF